MFFIRFWWVFCPNDSEKINKVTPVLRIIFVKMILYPVISLWQAFLLCPALYCVQHINVSSTLLCPTKYCVHTYPKGLLFTFHISMCCGRIMLRLRSTSVSHVENSVIFFSATMQVSFLICGTCSLLFANTPLQNMRAWDTCLLRKTQY